MDSFQYCETLVRAADRDRFLTVLFAPAEHRKALFALYAFNVEIARISELVRQPLAGEIRLQWWSDLFASEARGDVQANPVAEALLATKVRYNLPADQLQTLIDAHRFDLYDDPMQSTEQLESYARSVSCNLIALAARILVNGRDANMADLIEHAGIAYAVAGLLKALAMHAQRRRIYLPVDILKRHGSSIHEVTGGRATSGLRAALAELRLLACQHLDQAGKLMQAVPAAVMPALLPVALVPPTLARMEHRTYNPFVRIEIAPWRRQWLIWRAARNPERIFCAEIIPRPQEGCRRANIPDR
jgi:15-cis-phytoene synthase